MTLWRENGVGHEAQFRWVFGAAGAGVMILMLINYVHDCVDTTEGGWVRQRVGGREREREEPFSQMSKLFFRKLIVFRFQSERVPSSGQWLCE